jgi:hypothetical protein
MIANLNNKKIQWLIKCKSNIEKFQNEYEQNGLNENLNNIHLQYYNLYSILNVIDGKSDLYGVHTKLFKK